jgi:hypothetical protein
MEKFISISKGLRSGWINDYLDELEQLQNELLKGKELKQFRRSIVIQTLNYC